jgi:hypothetical protein
MAPLYKPPTRVTTVQMPYLALVNQADENWARRKHREVEYEFYDKIFLADPYVRGAYDTPSKSVTQNYNGPTTFAVGDLTGVGYDFVKLINTGTAPGSLTTRTASQMFGDIASANVLMQWVVRIVNFGGTPPTNIMQIVPGAGVILYGNALINPNTFTDFLMTFTDSADATMQVITSNNLYTSVTIATSGGF